MSYCSYIEKTTPLMFSWYICWVLLHEWVLNLDIGQLGGSIWVSHSLFCFWGLNCKPSWCSVWLWTVFCIFDCDFCQSPWACNGKLFNKLVWYLNWVALSRCSAVDLYSGGNELISTFPVFQELANLPTVELIDKDGSPSGPKLFLLWNPPLYSKNVSAS